MKARWPLFIVLVLAYAWVSMWPAWQRVRGVAGGRDYATYHYAVQEAAAGGDPYQKSALSERARSEGARRGGVHPYFYPPPFLLAVSWGIPLTLPDGYRVFFWLSQLCVVGAFFGMWRWIRAPPLLLALIAAAWTPLADSAKMGQANALVLLLIVFGLAHKRGPWIGAAAMSKMSPAVFVVWWAVARRWRAVAVAVVTAVLLSLAALPLADLDTQIRFYTEVLPGFSGGSYPGLTVPIALRANHSIPDLFNQLWPGPDPQTLSSRARFVSSGMSLMLFGALCWFARRRRDVLGDANWAGAFTVLMLIMPVYTYEHHLVFAVIPAVAAGTACVRGRLGRPAWWAVGLAGFFVAWPLYWLRPAQKALPQLHWLLQESKFLGLIGLGLACALAALRSPDHASKE